MTISTADFRIMNFLFKQHQQGKISDDVVELAERLRVKMYQVTFLNYDYLGVDKTQYLIREVNKLLHELNDALGDRDTFGIPAEPKINAILIFTRLWRLFEFNTARGLSINCIDQYPNIKAWISDDCVLMKKLSVDYRKKHSAAVVKVMPSVLEHTEPGKSNWSKVNDAHADFDVEYRQNNLQAGNVRVHGVLGDKRVYADSGKRAAVVQQT